MLGRWICSIGRSPHRIYILGDRANSIVLFRSKDIHGGRFVLFRYARPRGTGFLGSALKGEGRTECQQGSRSTDVCLFSNSPARYHFGKVQCQVTEWEVANPTRTI
ncbi:hypothetical protein C4D60_Mb00t11720 [Musa balbisiana]|uniref:Uncharacterized protein n=1 Tax=Musa balbisiana TaxID=52838 RepID=A0A4S8I2E0_MUSBA|nr:hypothetical protein C4D60_Mb00t11720 [Musa balbisiana]